MKTIKQLAEEVNSTFLMAFGRTPLRQRLEDIDGEAKELNRFTDLKNLREETGDLLATTIQLCNECEWDIEELLRENKTKIERRKNQYTSLGRKKYVAILGGAFDPITIGHIKLAQFVLDTSKTFDEVWIMPCYKHIYNKDMESSEHRLNMSEIAAQMDGRIKIFEYEITNQLGGETYNFAKRILEEDYAKDEYDFSLIIGMDNANTFDQWVNYEDLERMMRFVVVDREGIERDPKIDWYLKNGHIYLNAESSIPEISSTQIRGWLSEINGKQLNPSEETINSLKKSLPEGVYDYIEKNKLYVPEWITDIRQGE